MTDTPTERAAESTWARLRRRKVVQWTIAYVAGAWALVQGLALAADTYGWAPIITQVAMLGLALGLPIVVTLAWYHGDRGQQRVSGRELSIVAILLLAGGGLLWWYADRSVESPEAVSTTTVPAATPTDPRPSIAVLPFDNRSKLEDDVFFVDGIHDDILTQLSRISALKVISRTSVEHFRNSSLPTREIAARLGVKSILEGGVQRAGDRVRVTVQLVDADNDSHLWAEHYDRELTTANIFAIQSDVASAIADALQAKLTPSERDTVNAMPTQNLAAWEAYQLGRQAVSRRTTATIAAAVKHFETAIKLDPAFALAYVALADTLTLQVDYDRAERGATADRAEKLVARALELEPGLPEAAVSSAMIAWTRFDYPLAESEFKRAITLNPNSAQANNWYASILRELNRPQEALVYARRAAQLDPRTPLVTAHVGVALEMLGRLDEAEAEYRKATEIDPLQANPNRWYADALRVWGRPQEALIYARRAAQLDPRTPLVTAEVGATLEMLGRFDEAAAQYRKAIELEPSKSNPYFMIGMLEYGLGHIDKGVPWVQRAIEVEPALPQNGILLWHMYLDLGLDARADRLMAQATSVTDDGWPLHYMTSIDALLAGRWMLAEEHAKAMLAIDQNNPMMLAVLRDALLRKGDVAKAQEHYAQAFPKLLASAGGVDQGNYWAAIDLAVVLKLQATVDLAVVLKLRDDDESTARLLALSEAAIRGMPRLGSSGFGIADVQVHALRGERSKALALLREAADAGWRSFWRYSRDFDPALASIRNEPEFKAVFADIERDMARQRAALAARPKDAPLDLAATGT